MPKAVNSMLLKKSHRQIDVLPAVKRRGFPCDFPLHGEASGEFFVAS